MSAQPPNNLASAAHAGKKAVHVKWAGKTIALGTFPSTEADEKCAKAKALTRAWRSTMRPKPSREWVMLELERLGVRVVSGRLGRKAGEDGDDEDEVKKPGDETGAAAGVAGPAGVIGGLVGDLPAERRGSAGWGTDADLNRLMARRNSSLGFGMMNERRGSLGSLGGLMGLDSTDLGMPLGMGMSSFGVGADFNQKGPDQQRRSSSLGLGSLGGGIGGMGMSVNPNQHYEMLKLHHMNLLNEIQETTLMMNLYQQQQLQQQQQKLQQQASAEGLASGDSQIIQPSFGGTQMAQRNSLGLGGTQLDFASQQMLMQQQMQSSGMGGTGEGSNLLPGASILSGTNPDMIKTETPVAGAASGKAETKKRAPKGTGAKSKAKKVKAEDPAVDAKQQTTNV